MYRCTAPGRYWRWCWVAGSAGALSRHLPRVYTGKQREQGKVLHGGTRLEEETGGEVEWQIRSDVESSMYVNIAA